MFHRTVTVTIDRPLGTCHPKHPDLVYPVNYGYVEGILAPDGDWQDAYILGISQPVASFTGEVIAVIHRRDDVEDKWIVVQPGLRLTKEEIRHQTLFQEQFFDSWIEMCGGERG